MGLLTAIILENEGFSLNDLNMIQRMALKKVYSGRFNPDRVSDKETVVLDSLVDLGLLDIGYDLTPDGEHAASLLGKYSKSEREDLSIAKQLAAADAKSFKTNDDEGFDDDEFPFTENEHAIMKAAGLRPSDIAKLFLKENVLSDLTHYVIDPRNKELVTAFKLVQCDSCEADIAYDNPIEIDLDGAKRLKLKRLDFLPQEMESDDAGQAQLCPECADNDEYDEVGDGMTDAEADADTLASAGWGTDEDYGYFGNDEY